MTSSLTVLLVSLLAIALVLVHYPVLSLAALAAAACCLITGCHQEVTTLRIPAEHARPRLTATDHNA